MMPSSRYSDTTFGEPGRTYPVGKFWSRPLSNMQTVTVSNSTSEEMGKRPFTTIDDLVPLADALVSGLHKLADYKHPLAVRKASRIRREVRRMDNKDSKQVNGSWRTYFLDIRKTKEDKPRPYLVITESRRSEEHTSELQS